jgi:acyl-coenzyme A thioesterase PaaI-like protein
MKLETIVNQYLLNLAHPLTMKDRIFLDKILSFKIAFNRPHGILVRDLSPTECTTTLPMKSLNTNHLKGIHACALALVGEYSSGLIILRNTGLKDYRIILKEMHVKYEKQAKGQVTGRAVLTSEHITQLKEELPQSGEVLIKLQTEMFNQKNERVAVAETHWHLKNWNKVKFQ